MIKGSIESLAEGLELAVSIKFGETDETRTIIWIIKNIHDPARLRMLMNILRKTVDI